MGSAYRKDIRRSITSSWGRFIALAVIAALGCGFYAGLRMTAPDMRLAGDMYYDGTNMCDLRVMSDLGVSEQTAALLERVEGVDEVMCAYEADAMVDIDSCQYAVRVHSLDMEAAATSDMSSGYEAVTDTEDYVNRPVLVEGEWPDEPGECVLGADPVMDSDVALGDTVTLLEGTSSLDDTFELTEYTIVGFARSSYYNDITNLGTTSLGSGSIDQYLYIASDDFADDLVYTEAFVTVEGAAQLDSSGEEYDELVAQVAARIEALSSGLSAQRLDEVRSDAQAELDEMQAEYDEERADAEGELADAKSELDDAAAQLADAKSELASSAGQLTDARAQLDESADELAASADELKAGAAQLSDAQAQLDAQAAELEQGHADWDAAVAQRDDLASQLEQAREAVRAIDAQLGGDADAALAAAQQAVSQADAALAAYEPQDAEDAGYQQLAAAAQAAVARLSTVQAAVAQRDELEAGIDQLKAAIATIDTRTEGLSQAYFDDADTQLAAAQAELDARAAELSDGWAAYRDGAAQYQAACADYEDGVAAYQAGKAEYDSGLAEHEDGVAEYEERAAEAYAQLDGAQAELDDAQADIDGMETPDIYVLDRTKNSGAVSYASDADRIDQIARVFPLFFFLVAALVALTTMTRMVEEERMLIGTYKALGYGNGRIIGKYLLYAFIASAAGAVVGIALLGFFLPWFIMRAYAIIHVIPVRPTPLDPGLSLLSAGVGIGIVLIATYASARSMLRERPASLMQQRAPKPGKRVFLERITPLWERMSFSWKVTTRNILRYKKRFIMVLVGVAGCTALLLTGLGLNNAINDIIDKQFGDVYNYQLLVGLDEDADDRDVDAALGALDENAIVEGYARAASENMIARNGDDEDERRVDFVVPQDPQEFAGYVDMHERVGKEALTLEEDGVIVTEKLAKQLGVTVGDTVCLYAEDDIGNATGEPCEFTVAGVMENYVQQYVYASPELAAQVMGEAPVYDKVYAQVAEDEAARSVLSDTLLAMDAVKTVSFSTETIATYRTMLTSVNAVVVVLVVAAAVLAFVVLYNLTNINITERAREIATLKVLGFSAHEVSAYIYRETLLLAAIGALCGVVFGIWMESFVVTTAEVDAVMFGRSIHAMSFIASFVLTMGFAAIVTFFMRGKLRRIDMVESLKAME